MASVEGEALVDFFDVAPWAKATPPSLSCPGPLSTSMEGEKIMDAATIPLRMEDAALATAAGGWKGVPIWFEVFISALHTWPFRAARRPRGRLDPA